MEKNFIRVRSNKDIIITAALIVGGCILVALPTGASVNIVGFFMIFAGFILAFVLKTGYKDAETGDKYIKSEHFFAQSMREQIAKSIAVKPETVDIKEEDKGNGIRLDIYHSKKNGKAYIQLFEYIPYKYEPCSNIYEYELSKVKSLTK